MAWHITVVSVIPNFLYSSVFNFSIISFRQSTKSLCLMVLLFLSFIIFFKTSFRKIIVSDGRNGASAARNGNTSKTDCKTNRSKYYISQIILMSGKDMKLINNLVCYITRDGEQKVYIHFIQRQGFQVLHKNIIWIVQRI